MDRDDLGLPAKCSQRDCNDTATRIVYWPGKVPPPRYCLIHAITAINILAAMGCQAPVEEILFLPATGDANDAKP